MRLLRAARRHGSGRSRSSTAHQRCSCCSPPAPSTQSAMLTRLREALPNARDLNEAFPAIRPGRLIRCANPSSTRIEDVEFLLGELRVRDLIDLRSAEEIREDDAGSALMRRTVTRSYRRAWMWPGKLAFRESGVAGRLTTAGAAAAPAAAAAPSSSPSPSPSPPQTMAAEPTTLPSTWPSGSAALVEIVASSAIATSTVAIENSTTGTTGSVVMAVRHNISLLDRGRYYISLAGRIPATTTAAALLTNFVNKPAARSFLLPYVNGGGLPMLYEMLLESSRPEIRQVMELVLRAAESRHCAMFFCRAGKDRTGLVAALVLEVAGATEDQIVEDYARSDAYHRVALAGLESREELAGLDRAQFERAPHEVMRATLEHVRRRYGSLSGYLTGVGFGPDRQHRLRELLTCDW